MCGLTGFVTFQPFADAGQARHKVQAMTRSIKHRGPDAEGHWLDDTQGVALGHRRLSILDLSPSGPSLCTRTVAGMFSRSMGKSTTIKRCESI